MGESGTGGVWSEEPVDVELPLGDEPSSPILRPGSLYQLAQIIRSRSEDEEAAKAHPLLNVFLELTGTDSLSGAVTEFSRMLLGSLTNELYTDNDSSFSDTEELDDSDQEDKDREAERREGETAVLGLLEGISRQISSFLRDLTASDGYMMVPKIPGSPCSLLLEDTQSAECEWKDRQVMEEELRLLVFFFKAFLRIRDQLKDRQGFLEKIDALTLLLKSVEGMYGEGWGLEEVEWNEEEGVKTEKEDDDSPLVVIENLQPGMIDAVRSILGKLDGNTWNLEELAVLDRVEWMMGRYEFMETLMKWLKDAASVTDVRVISSYARVMRMVYDRLTPEERRRAMRHFYAQIGRCDKDIPECDSEFETEVWRVDDWAGCLGKESERRREKAVEPVGWFLMLRLKGKGSYLFKLLKMAVEKPIEGVAVSVRSILSILCQFKDPVLEWKEPEKDTPLFVEALQHLCSKWPELRVGAFSVGALNRLLVGLAGVVDPMLILKGVILSGLTPETKLDIYSHCLKGFIDADVPIVWCGKKEGAESAWEGDPGADPSPSETGSGWGSFNVPSVLGQLAKLTESSDSRVSRGGKEAMTSVFQAVQRNKVILDDAALDYIESLDSIPAAHKFQMMVASGRKPPIPRCLFQELSEAKKKEFCLVKCVEGHREEGTGLRCLFDAIFHLWEMDKEMASGILEEALGCLKKGRARLVLVDKAATVLLETPEKMDSTYEILSKLVRANVWVNAGLVKEYKREVMEANGWEALFLLGDGVMKIVGTPGLAKKYVDLLCKEWDTRRAKEEQNKKEKIRESFEIQCLEMHCVQVRNGMVGGEECGCLDDLIQRMRGRLDELDKSLKGWRKKETQDMHTSPIHFPNPKKPNPRFTSQRPNRNEIPVKQPMTSSETAMDTEPVEGKKYAGGPGNHARQSSPTAEEHNNWSGRRPSQSPPQHKAPEVDFSVPAPPGQQAVAGAEAAVPSLLSAPPRASLEECWGDTLPLPISSPPTAASNWVMPMSDANPWRAPPVIRSPPVKKPNVGYAGFPAVPPMPYGGGLSPSVPYGAGPGSHPSAIIGPFLPQQNTKDLTPFRGFNGTGQGDHNLLSDGLGKMFTGGNRQRNDSEQSRPKSGEMGWSTRGSDQPRGNQRQTRGGGGPHPHPRNTQGRPLRSDQDPSWRERGQGREERAVHSQGGGSVNRGGFDGMGFQNSKKKKKSKGQRGGRNNDNNSKREEK